MKFVFIAKHRNIWPVAWLCEAMGVSRSDRAISARQPSILCVAIVGALSIGSLHAESLKRLNPGAENVFPTQLRCPAGGDTGILEYLQRSRKRAQLIVRLEYKSGTLLTAKIFTAEPDEQAFKLELDLVVNTPMSDREGEFFQKSTLQGGNLLKDVCLKDKNVQREFQLLLRTNDSILDGKLAED